MLILYRENFPLIRSKTFEADGNKYNWLSFLNLIGGLGKFLAAYADSNFLPDVEKFTSALDKKEFAVFSECHFKDIYFSSKQGVFFAALNLPQYKVLALHYCRPSNRYETVHDCVHNQNYLQSRVDTFLMNHLQFCGRSARVSPFEQYLFEKYGIIPRRVYYLGNLGLTSTGSLNFKYRDTLVKALLANPIFDLENITSEHQFAEYTSRKISNITESIFELIEESNEKTITGTGMLASDSTTI